MPNPSTRTPASPALSWRHFAFVAACVLLFHGPLIINDGVYLEDFAMYDWFEDGRKADFIHHMAMYANLLPAYYMWWISQLPASLLFFKLTVFISFLTAHLCILYCAHAITKIGAWPCAMVAVIAALYPGHLTTAHVNLSFHFYCYVFYWIGLVLALMPAQRPMQPAATVFLRSLSLVFFFLGFALPSLLVLHFGIVLAIALRDLAGAQGNFRRAAATFLKNHWELLLIPFVFWLWRKLIAPPFDYGAGHTSLILNVKNIVMLYWSLFKLLASQIGFIVLSPPFLFPALVLAWLARKRIADGPVPARAEVRKWTVLLAMAVFLVLAGALPYVLTGRNFSTMDTDAQARNRLLLMMPMGLFIVSAIWLICHQRRAFYIAVAASVILSMGVYRLKVYYIWELEAIKNHSILRNLARLPGVREVHVFGARDLVKEGFDRIREPQGYGSLFSPHASNGFKLALGDFTRFVVYEGDSAEGVAGGHWYTRDELQPPGSPPILFPARYDPCGKQAGLVVAPGPGFSESNLVFRYYLLKFFDSARLADFLQNLTALTLHPRPAPASCLPQAPRL